MESQIVSCRFYYYGNLLLEVAGSGWLCGWLVMIDEDDGLDVELENRYWSVPEAPVVVAVAAAGSWLSLEGWLEIVFINVVSAVPDVVVGAPW